MSDVVGTVRVRREDSWEEGRADIYVKVSENSWQVVYVSPEQAIGGRCSDPLAERWPVVYSPTVLDGNLK